MTFQVNVLFLGVLILYFSIRKKSIFLFCFYFTLESQGERTSEELFLKEKARIVMSIELLRCK